MDLLRPAEGDGLLVALPLLTLSPTSSGVRRDASVAWWLLDFGLGGVRERVPDVLSWRSLLVGLGRPPCSP